MNITIMDHVGINVIDLQRSADWYRRVLGFEIMHTWEDETPRVWQVGKGQMRIGLFLSPNATPIDDPENKLAISHFAFLTDANGLQAARKQLTDQGIAYTTEDTGVADSIFMRDPDNYTVNGYNFTFLNV